MTSITTKTYVIDKNALFKLLVSHRYIKRWWISAVAFVCVTAVLYFFMNADTTTSVMTLGVVIILGTASTLLSIWRFVNGKGARIFYLSRHYVMDTEKISSFLEDGSTNTIMIKNFIKTDELGGYYLLYLTKGQYVFIPRTAFKTPEDQQWFETNIVGRIRTPGF